MGRRATILGGRAFRATAEPAGASLCTIVRARREPRV